MRQFTLVSATVLFFMVMLPALSYAQYTVSGILQDKGGNAVEFAEVIVTGSEKTVTSSTLTNEKGFFTLTSGTGNYSLYISFMGSEVFRKEIEVNKDINLGQINVEIAKQLDEVLVEQKKRLVERKVDRLIFNVENTIAASGGDALDALRLVPRVKVENDVVSIIGKGSILVMIDDRIMRLTGDELTAFLKSIRADDIKSIEVITNPPAKYSAEGNSGIINIRLKKAKHDAWNGYIQSTYKQNTYASGLNNAGFNYQKDKLAIQASVGKTDGANGPINRMWFSYPEYLWDEVSGNNSRFDLLNGRFSADYKLTDKFTTGIQYYGQRNNYETNDITTVNVINNTTQVRDSIIKTLGNDTAKNKYNSINYHFVYTMDTIGKKLSFDIDYFRYSTKSDRTFETDTYDVNGIILPERFTSLNNMGNRRVDNFSANADMEHPLKFMKMNYGARYSNTKTSSDFGLYNLSSGVPVWDASQSNEFVFKENTYAGFIDAAKEFGKWEAKAGLRVESTHTNGRSLTTGQQNTIDYTKLFPTAYLVFKPTEDHSISLNYGRRIQRPNFEFLNPFRFINSQYSYSEGNPYLQPSFANALELEYGYKDNYTVALYYSKIKGDFENLAIIDAETGVQANRPLNFINNTTIGLTQYVTLKPFEWYQLNFNADVYYCDSRSSIPVTLQFLNGWNGEFRLNSDFTLDKSKTFLFNVNYIYVTAGTANLDTNTAFSQLNATLKLFLLNKKLQFSLNGNDILATHKTTYTGVSNNVKTSYRNYGDLKMLRFTVLYSFGGDVKNNERENKNAEEQNRL